ncbi:MAG: universal stress protein [Caulobacter sp.]|nr:universal stress protein [Caulobacter sp.]
MSYRDILVQVDDRAATAGRAAAAAALAGRSGAHLSGVFLRAGFMRNAMASEALANLPPDTLDQLINDHDAGVAKASESARAMFELAAGEAGVVSDFREISGDSDVDLIAHARRSDLTIMPANITASLGMNRISAADVGMASGTPVLVAPAGDFGPAIGKRVLIAWKGSRESARALQDAWPLVTAADEVHVLVIAPEGEGGPEGLLQRHLEHHGCKPNIIIDRSEDASAGDILRRQVEALNVDLLIMGLYGRPRLQEFILGGVSRALLDHPPCALLVSH